MWFKVKKVINGDNKNMTGREEFLRSYGIEVIELKDRESEEVFEDYVKEHPERWAGV